jgi:hypothetical protein
MFRKLDLFPSSGEREGTYSILGLVSRISDDGRSPKPKNSDYYGKFKMEFTEQNIIVLSVHHNKKKYHVAIL